LLIVIFVFRQETQKKRRLQLPFSFFQSLTFLSLLSFSLSYSFKSQSHTSFSREWLKVNCSHLDVVEHLGHSISYIHLLFYFSILVQSIRAL
jgi:hypothetical protein